ncbi:hypothetical protein VTN96DRAFT_2161 [Rasamsonia emersonii]
MISIEGEVDYQPQRGNSQEHTMPVLPKIPEPLLFRSMGTLVESTPGEITVSDSTLNHDFYSAAGTWLQSNWTYQLSEPGSMQMLDSWSPRMLKTPRTFLLGSPETTTDEEDTYHLLSSSHSAGLQYPHDWNSCQSDSTFSFDLDDKGVSTSDRNYSLVSSPQKCQPSETSISDVNCTSIKPQMPLFTDSSSPSLGRRSSTCTATLMSYPAPHEESMDIGIGDLDESENTEPPYSQLIYRALKSAPGMRLSLQDIYSWFERNTAKGRGPRPKAWQSSIRHNLSMNAVCLFALELERLVSIANLVKTGIRGCEGRASNKKEGEQLLAAD